MLHFGSHSGRDLESRELWIQLASTMPRCPRCSKQHKSQTRLLQHMNHPASQCNDFLNELVKIPDTTLSRHFEEPNLRAVQEDVSMEDYGDDMASPPGLGEIPPSTEWSSESVRISESKYCVEAHPSASQVYGRGHTFLDVFDADPCAEKRKDNLYYPFASRQEWEIASFLLRSSLSMSAVDEFLSLNLVSSLLYYVYYAT